MASAVNMLGDLHGGEGGQAVELFQHVQAFDRNIDAALETWLAKNGKFIPGFGHRFHKPVDPRAPRLLTLVMEAVEDGACSGHFSTISQAIEAKLTKTKGQSFPMNIDRATAVILCRAGLCTASCARTNLSVPLRWDFGKCLGTYQPRGAQQRTNTPALWMDIHGLKLVIQNLPIFAIELSILDLHI